MNRVIRPRAQDDILRQFRWYLVEKDASDAAFRFVDAVEASVEQLLRMPNMGAPRELRNPALKGLRVWPVKQFEEFLIYYVVEGDTVRVIRILHGKRDLDRILKKESADDDALR
ncbi:MAG TPA: type II toxin-antitoxin system RelE/ParE family toxin [Candidatus Acidoferrales bacterium]|nr:type II toxin-antitoxin system RelE/ParE family toxin [Candidatus Acidoferrales bacterium]